MADAARTPFGHPSAALALLTGDLTIMFLSAEHGFRDVNMRIADYDRKMTAARADELCGMWSANGDELSRRFADAENAIFVGGALYRRAMWTVSGAHFGDPEKVTDTDGAGIGHHRAQLGNWLEEHYPASAA